MAAESITVSVSRSLYRRLERLAALTHRPVDSLIEQTLASTIPPLPDDLPAEMQGVLLGLESLDDASLAHLMWSMVPPEQQEQLAHLQDKRRHGALTKTEVEQLARLHQNADELMLRKAYAAVLLKWRGHRLPTLADLEASG